MKNVLMIGLISFSLFSCKENGESESQVGQYTTIEVQSVYDGGTVAKGAIIDADIAIKNTGDYPLVIADIKPACNCTVSKYDEDPIPPGKMTIVKATLDTDKTGSGKISKPITITANTKPSTTTITIKANVTN